MRYLLPLFLSALMACGDSDDTGGLPAGESMTPTMQQITIHAGESKRVYAGYSWQVVSCSTEDGWEECRDVSDPWVAWDGWLCLNGGGATTPEECTVDMTTASEGYYVVTVLL